jgi:hypothetical protein
MNWSDIADIRYNPATGVWTPQLIGYGSVTPERHTVDANGQIFLYEYIQQRIPSITNITDVVTPLNLLSEITSPNPGLGKYWVCYDELGNGTAQFHSTMIGKDVDVKYSGLGTRLQRNTLAYSITGFPTVVLASTDSMMTSITNATQVISVGADAGAIINTWITTINAAGGGRLVMYEGTYNCATQIDLLSNCTIEGCGFATVLKRAAATPYIISAASVTNVGVKNLSLDGNKAVYNIGNLSGLTANNSQAIQINNVQTYSNIKYGFYRAYNMNNCTSYSNTSDGFYDCLYLTLCKSYSNTASGFNDCSYISSSKSNNNTLYGFLNSYSISSSLAEYNTKSGFCGCSYCSSSRSVINAEHGFVTSKNISSCQAYVNTSNGFDACTNLTTNRAENNVTYGFRECHRMGFNQATSNGTNYYLSYADDAYDLICADNANGGFNSI